MSVNANCLCGKVKLKIAKTAEQFGACHCSMCRTWSGGPALVADCGTDVSIQGSSDVAVYNSSDWAERAFCKNCGTHLFYRLKNGSKHFIPLGLLENADQLKFDHQVFFDKKPTNYNFSEKTKNMTEAEVIAMWSSSNSNI